MKKQTVKATKAKAQLEALRVAHLAQDWVWFQAQEKGRETAYRGQILFLDESVAVVEYEQRGKRLVKVPITEVFATQAALAAAVRDGVERWLVCGGYYHTSVEKVTHYPATVSFRSSRGYRGERLIHVKGEDGKMRSVDADEYALYSTEREALRAVAGGLRRALDRATESVRYDQDQVLKHRARAERLDHLIRRCQELRIRVLKPTKS